MIFRYIKLKNFCPYYDEQTIHFATDEYCNVTVIRGINGTGKTSLLTALNWCLYGDSFFKGNTREFVNRRVVAQAENADTSVEIGIVDQNIRYRVLRKCRSLRNDKTTLLLQKENEPPDLDAAASDKIRSMIPEDVSAHFFFDGEKIDNFARQGNEEEIKSAVRNVLRIELFERGITHLEKVAQNYQSKLKRYVPDKLKILINEKEEKEALCLSERKKVDDRLEKIKIARKHKQDIDKVLQEYEDTRQLFEEEKKIIMDLKHHMNEKEKYQVKIRELANDGYIPLAKPVIQKALKILQSSKAPIGIPETVLNEILEQMYCLCGRSIHQGSSEYKHIQNLISQNVSPEFGVAARETENSLKRLLEGKVENIPVDVKSTLSEEQRLDKSIEANEARLEEIKGSLQNFDDDDFQKHKNAQDKYTGEIRFLEGEINQIKEKIREIKMEIEALDKEIDKAESLKVDAERLNRCRRLAMESAAAMKKLYEPHEENIRRNLENEVSNIFKRLIWKENSFREVRFSLDYELQVIDRYDGQVSSEISAGEREVLSLAFIAALAKVAVKEKLPDIPAERFPIVMDAPFTKLSDKPKENITENIPAIANQLILFVTDQELRPDEQAWRNLEPRIGTEYELCFDDEISVTTIKRIE
ncbi:hypothetical protein C6499_16895 [Candidatus Poribacteria bacterium]|nr:MAG: hypothetical protein C6499_16895 [Candidatus Poribacteria bacterium]